RHPLPGTTQLGEWRGRAIGADELDGRYALSSAGPPFPPSGQAHEPTVLVLGPSVLDVEQRLAQLHGLLSGILTVIDGEVLGHELADRRDDRGRAAGEGLDDLTAGRTLAPFLDGDPALLGLEPELRREFEQRTTGDRKSTRLNSSHVSISYAVFCLKKKNPTARRSDPWPARTPTPWRTILLLLRGRSSATTTARSMSSPLSLHDALPISRPCRRRRPRRSHRWPHPRAIPRWRSGAPRARARAEARVRAANDGRSEEHTSELQSRFDLVCRLLLEKKKSNSKTLRPVASAHANTVAHDPPSAPRSFLCHHHRSLHVLPSFPTRRSSDLAAVPQAKASTISPLAAPSRHSSMEIRRSSGSSPS